MENNHDIYYKLFACCLPVKGSRRCAIVDLQREKIYFIPNDLYVFLIKNQKIKKTDIFNEYNGNDLETILEYINFLKDNELIFETNEPDSFPDMTMSWETPILVTNAIIDIKNDFIDINKIFENLSIITCKHVQLRIFFEAERSWLIKIIEIANEYPFRSIEIIVKYSEWMDLDSLSQILRDHSNVYSIIVYGAENSTDKNTEFEMGLILFIDDDIGAILHCGKIHPTLFNINIPTFTESHHHNSCLNRKISIDVDGNIKNCPSMPQSFGNIRDTTLEEALNHPDFKKYWNVTKDQIAVCKDCEFRYICTDCRAYIENPEDMYSKPLKCGYNPYTCEWEEWSTNPLKQKAIDYYGMREVLPEFKMKPDYVPPHNSTSAA